MENYTTETKKRQRSRRNRRNSAILTEQYISARSAHGQGCNLRGIVSTSRCPVLLARDQSGPRVSYRLVDAKEDMGLTGMVSVEMVSTSRAKLDCNCTAWAGLCKGFP